MLVDNDYPSNCYGAGRCCEDQPGDIAPRIAVMLVRASKRLKGIGIELHLDDQLPTRECLHTCRWPEEAIQLLKTGSVTHLSINHDLSDDAHGAVYDVILWHEEQFATTNFQSPEVAIHSANVSARSKNGGHSQQRRDVSVSRLVAHDLPPF